MFGLLVDKYVQKPEKKKFYSLLPSAEEKSSCLNMLKLDVLHNCAAHHVSTTVICAHTSAQVHSGWQ